MVLSSALAQKHADAQAPLHTKNLESDVSRAWTTLISESFAINFEVRLRLRTDEIFN